ncbi:MAG: TIR domain-containing protein [Pedobacter sp.]|nr:MAG: TIR domain-containing protein [Pedobacter sp.]
MAGSKRRHLFISHHHKDDNEVTKLTNLMSSKGFDVRNSSVRMNPDNQKRMAENRVKKEVIERILRMKISWASTVVVIIGKDTHSRKWVNWEIDKANEQGKRIVGVYARGAAESDIPPSLEDHASAIVKWNADSILNAIDGNNTFQTPTGDDRQGPNLGNTSNC